MLVRVVKVSTDPTTGKPTLSVITIESVNHFQSLYKVLDTDCVECAISIKGELPRTVIDVYNDENALATKPDCRPLCRVDYTGKGHYLEYSDMIVLVGAKSHYGTPRDLTDAEIAAIQIIDVPILRFPVLRIPVKRKTKAALR